MTLPGRRAPSDPHKRARGAAAFFFPRPHGCAGIGPAPQPKGKSMGTRGIIGFIDAEGAVKGSYNHFDSYPSALGVRLQKEMPALTEHGWEVLAKLAGVIRWVTDSDEPSYEDVEKFADLKENVSTGRDWYSLLRAQQGSIALMLSNGVAVASHDFARDSLFCEWGWLLDLRSKEVVILEGFNKNPEAQAPYCRASQAAIDEQKARSMRGDNEIYYGCREVWRGTPEAFLALDMEAFERSFEEGS